MNEDKELEAIREKKLKRMMENHSKTGGRGDARLLAITKPTVVTDDTFSSTIQGPGPVVVDCWAPWCGPCRFLSPIVEELARDYAGKILFGKLNVDENPGVAARYEVMSIPTLLIFRDGKLVDKIIGAMPRHLLEPKITHYL